MAKRSPRLQFTEEERTSPKLKKPIRKADRQMDKLEKAEAKIPKKKRKQRVVDPDTGNVTTRLSFEEKKPPSKLTHPLEAPGETVLHDLHREIRDRSDGNSGVEAANTLSETAESGYQMGRSAHRSHKLKPYRKAQKAALKADRANVKALNREFQKKTGGFSSNPYSRWMQKKAIKKEYAAVKAGKGAKNTVRASETTAKAAKRAAKGTETAGRFLARNWKPVLVVGGIAALLLFLATAFSSCSLIFQGVSSGIVASTYPSMDEDMLSAESAYVSMEQELQELLDNYERDHDYDEYHYDLDDIEHDPYVLISAITALYGGEWTMDDIGDILQMLFERQYILTEEVIVETRYRTETDSWTDEDGNTHTETYQVPYDYYICYVSLENFNLSHVPVYVMNEEQLSLYALYMSVLGNRPDLFSSSEYIGIYYETEYEDYEIPPEALEDEQFASIIAEAEKYLGYPYVWGGSSPATSFDCSGFVSYVYNNCGVGWNFGRLGASGLLGICTRVSEENVRPGDLIFFEGTYDTAGASHVGIYVGDGMMIHCGDPIQYTSIHTSYWQSHFLAYGRLASP